MGTSERSTPEQDEQHLARLIREAGPRQQPPADVRDAVRVAAHREWRAMVRARAPQQRRASARWSLAAAASIAGLAAWLALPMLATQEIAMASLERVSGAVELGRAGLLGEFAPAREGATVLTGQEIRSGRGGRAALDVAGVSLRLDEGTVVAALAVDRVELKQGALYVDVAPGTSAPALVVETPYGTIEHLGTQYEARLSDAGLRLRVREGRVRLAGKGRVVEAVAGEQLVMIADGELRREPVLRAGGDWTWVSAIAPPFDIDERPLADFLAWAARESGREISYASPASAAEAARVVLRGSVRGLTPERALAAVLSTTRLDYREESGESAERLVVDFSGDAR
jgi:ferric-dicitrate binding protein FerR (iron transport regulator)